MKNKIPLACATCGSRNYMTTINKKTQTARFERMKYCQQCKTHTNHQETK